MRLYEMNCPRQFQDGCCVGFFLFLLKKEKIEEDQKQHIDDKINKEK